MRVKTTRVSNLHGVQPKQRLSWKEKKAVCVHVPVLGYMEQARSVCAHLCLSQCLMQSFLMTWQIWLPVVVERFPFSGCSLFPLVRNYKSKHVIGELSSNEPACRVQQSCKITSEDFCPCPCRGSICAQSILKTLYSLIFNQYVIIMWLNDYRCVCGVFAGFILSHRCLVWSLYTFLSNMTTQQGVICLSVTSAVWLLLPSDRINLEKIKNFL